MTEYGVLAYCTAMGFVTAGTIASLYQLVTSQRADFVPSQPSALGWIVTAMLVIFGGPAIVAGKIWAGIRSREMSIPMAALGVLFTWMWSVCAGIFVVGLMVAA